VLIFSVYRAQSGVISAGELFLLFFYARSLYRPIRTSIKNASRVWRSLAQAERIIEILDTEYGVIDNKSSTPAPRFKGDIEFRDVSFSYDEDSSLMQGVNLKLKAGTITAIIGPTGAGKTTLVSMVPRLYDPVSGQVLIDGHDIREYTLESLRDQISVVLQETTLLYATVAENISYGKPGAALDEIEMAAWIAGAHDFIKDLPRGYNTDVGERGETLSGGQRQLIAISRAIIRDAPIVILDEPMTGLDPVSAVQVREGLNGLMEGRTVLLITHNLALLDVADYVIVVDGGRIAQQGTPDELRARPGIFMDLYRAQFEEESAFVAAAR
jgi:ABC-type multidrug transport system fused ATPase/permease subunit